MFPHAKDMPTGPFEAAGGFTVVVDVPGDLALPIGAIVAWHAQMAGAAVPEAAVHEDGETFTAEGEIGLAGKGLVATPAGDAVGTENGGEPQFGGAIPGGPDRGHDLRSLPLGEHVGHREIRSTEMAACESRSSSFWRAPVVWR